MLALGRRVAADLPPMQDYIEVATEPAVVNAVDAGGIDILILDGEASRPAAWASCRQLKDEIYQCPPVLVLTGRPQDGWLATWSRAEACDAAPARPGRARETGRRPGARPAAERVAA